MSKFAPLKNVCEFVLDGSHSSPERTEGGVPVLSAQNVKSGNLSYETDRYTSEAEYKLFNRRLAIKRGDLLLTIVGTIGRTAIVDEVKPAVFQRSVAMLRPRSDLMDSRFLFHISQSPRFKEQLRRATNQSSQAGVYLGKLSAIEVPVLKLKEQRRIAAILDKAEDLRAKRREAIAGIDGLMKALFLDRFGNPVTNPRAWKVRKLIEVSDFENGDRSSNYPSGDQIKQEGVLFLSTKNIVNNKLDLSSAVFITEEKFRSLSRGKAKRNDLIITLRGTLGSCCVFDSEDERAFINAQMMIIRPQEAVLYKYLHALITLPQAKAHFMRMGFGAAVQQLTASQLAELVIPVPPLELQQKFTQEITAAENVQRKLDNSANEIDTLFDSLQHRAFLGEL